MISSRNPKYVQRPTVEKIRHFQEVAKGLIKIITFAPEVEGITMLKRCCSVVKMRYMFRTSFYRFICFFKCGNSTEIIGDGIHSHPAAVDIAYKQKGATHMYLITDAMRAKGMKDGEYFDWSMRHQTHLDYDAQKVLQRCKDALHVSHLVLPLHSLLLPQKSKVLMRR
jgi:hypothetical protein